jgi:hypothetical protein
MNFVMKKCDEKYMHQFQKIHYLCVVPSRTKASGFFRWRFVLKNVQKRLFIAAVFCAFWKHLNFGV